MDRFYRYMREFLKLKLYEAINKDVGKMKSVTMQSVKDMYIDNSY